ncbi:hypothetical protein SKAU_G00331130 [Synaphobranchus kaupii]|uniref:Uncharacterized protein n=1 Tax=Synaphobranchus kaupii TaxID=118154 RepID=A0A9Q1ELB5_SYNKA|nr:hypothetical protein SKAU_G00331130 [Synaphobranchus kaupii]
MIYDVHQRRGCGVYLRLLPGAQILENTERIHGSIITIFLIIIITIFLIIIIITIFLIIMIITIFFIIITIFLIIIIITIIFLIIIMIIITIFLIIIMIIITIFLIFLIIIIITIFLAHSCSPSSAGRTAPPCCPRCHQHPQAL